jgi:nucleoredoxin
MSVYEIIGGATILNKDNSESNGEQLRGKIVGFYFSAHWCPPCRRFTPLLSNKYKELVESGKQFEIVFVSSDSTEEDCMSYYADMPWKLLKYDEQSIRDRLSTFYEIRGIPTLVLVDEEGVLLTRDGRSAIISVSFDKLKSFEADKLAAEQAETAKIASLPESIVHSCHPHPLAKTSGRHFGCDVCHGGGQGWSFYCKQCDFDAHPKCVFEDFA